MSSGKLLQVSICTFVLLSYSKSVFALLYQVFGEATMWYFIEIFAQESEGWSLDEVHELVARRYVCTSKACELRYICACKASKIVPQESEWWSLDEVHELSRTKACHASYPRTRRW
jgi:hypothetical protein